MCIFFCFLDPIFIDFGRPPSWNCPKGSKRDSRYKTNNPRNEDAPNIRSSYTEDLNSEPSRFSPTSNIRTTLNPRPTGGKDYDYLTGFLLFLKLSLKISHLSSSFLKISSLSSSLFYVSICFRVVHKSNVCENVCVRLFRNITHWSEMSNV